MKTNLLNGALLIATLALSMWAATLPGGVRTVVPTQGGAADAPERLERAMRGRSGVAAMPCRWPVGRQP